MDPRRQRENLEQLEKDVEELRRLSPVGDESSPGLERLRHEVADLTPWQRTQLARHPHRPYTLDYIPLLFESFSEIHGDRTFADDPALVCGMAAGLRRRRGGGERRA